MGKIRGANSSPGIYTQITDLQYAANILGITTLGLVGETLQGPAFEPIAISNWAQFQDYFGGTSTELFSGSKYPKYELPYIAKSYLQASDQLYVCRVLGLSGYNAGPAFVLHQNNKVIGVLRSKAKYNDPNGSACNGSGDDPQFLVSEVTCNTATNEYYKFNCGGESVNTSTESADMETIVELGWNDEKPGSVVVSLLPGSKNYIYNVLGSSASSGSYPIYVEALYDLEISENVKVDVISVSDTTTNENGDSVMSKSADYKLMFQHAKTPWFISELGGKVDKYYTAKKLFRIHTISDGDAANSQVKISIANIKPEDGTFDVLVRSFNDADGNPIVLESYKNVNLIPGNPNYLGLRMGTLNGDYALKSKYVIAEIIESEETEMSVPCGFLGYPVHQFDNETLTTPEMRYRVAIDTSRRINKQYFGLSDDIDVDMLYFKGCAAYAEDATTTKGFHLDLRAEGGLLIDGNEEPTMFTTVSKDEKVPVMTPKTQMEEGIYADVKARKFTCCPYGGFDGWDVNRTMRTTDDMYRVNKYVGSFFDNSSVNEDVEGLAMPEGYNTSDYYAYLAGANQFSNPDRFTINLFATPGIDCINNKSLTSDIIEMIEDRKDTFYVVTTPDKALGNTESVDDMFTASEVVGLVDDTGIDTYYASTYYPWVRYYDATNARYISLPVTKDVLRNMADVDNKKYPWYAPAGIERGNVECSRARIFTKLDDENVIYDGRINPVKTFSADGVKIWGNKTLYSGDTPMNRINTVRLVLYMRKLISESIHSLIFEPNDTTLKNQFEGIVKPILTQIKNDRGITDFRLIVSQTPEQMDAHEISAQIHIKPTPTLEYIELDFVVTPQGVQWDE